MVHSTGAPDNSCDFGRERPAPARKLELPSAGRDNLPHLLLQLCDAGPCRYPARPERRRRSQRRGCQPVRGHGGPGGGFGGRNPRGRAHRARARSPHPVGRGARRCLHHRRRNRRQPRRQPGGAGPRAVRGRRAQCDRFPAPGHLGPRRGLAEPLPRAVSSSYGLSPSPTSGAGRSHTASSGCRTSRSRHRHKLTSGPARRQRIRLRRVLSSGGCRLMCDGAAPGTRTGSARDIVSPSAPDGPRPRERGRAVPSRRERAALPFALPHGDHWQDRPGPA